MEEPKQYIILRKNPPTKTGEPVSPAKMAVMTAHASMAFLVRKFVSIMNDEVSVERVNETEAEWLTGSFAKVLLEAKDLNKIKKKAEDNGFIEDKDFFCIHDECRTELLPDEGENTCFMAIGFRPMLPSALEKVVKRLQVYK